MMIALTYQRPPKVALPGWMLDLVPRAAPRRPLPRIDLKKRWEREREPVANSNDELGSGTMSAKEAAQAALEAVQQGRRDDAGLLLFRHARKLMIRRLTYGNGSRIVGMAPEDAEECATDAIVRFTNSKPDGKASGLSWLYKCMDSQALDFHRRRLADKRGGDTEIGPLYGDDDKILPEVESAVPMFSSAAPARPGLADCMEDAIKAFEQDHAAYAQMLRLVAEDWDNEELAVYYGADPDNISPRLLATVRQRKSHALKMAREYFEPCKD